MLQYLVSKGMAGAEMTLPFLPDLSRTTDFQRKYLDDSNEEPNFSEQNLSSSSPDEFSEDLCDLRGRIQKLIYGRTMFIPLMKSTTPSAFGRRVKGDPFKIREPYPIWYPSPMEDLELRD